MYESKLSMKDTQKAIKIVKDNFEKMIAYEFNLDRVSAPIIVESDKGINDDLGIKNSALSFYIDTLNTNVEIVQSLAKWKRIALKKYGYNLYEGIYTDMNAIRPKDVVDKTHSLYVDQWDWELVIEAKDRNTDFLKDIVRRIVKSLSSAKKIVKKEYKELKEDIVEDVYFISSYELYKMYPNTTLEEREDLITKKYKTVFITEIGITFPNGEKHGTRAFDYDDWLLNGDLLIWSNVLNQAIELSSMGIRVNKKSLKNQMKGLDVNLQEYHNMILNDELPLTIGGGIGQSRLCMILLEKMHIAEVQASIWNDKEYKYFKENNINYL